MAITDKLLKEAIADAKTVVDTAMATARLQLEESFTPQLSSMLSAKLRNEEEDLDEQNKLDSSDIGAGGVAADSPGPKEPSKNASDSSDIDNPGQEVDTFGKGSGKKPMGEASAPADSPGANAKIAKDRGLEFGKGDPHKKPVNEDGFGGAPDSGAGDEFNLDTDGGAEQGADQGQDNGFGDHGGDELDLEAIIRELEADIQDGGDGDMSLGAQAPSATPAAAPGMEEANWQDVNDGVHVGTGTKTREQDVRNEDTGAGDYSDDGVKSGVNGGKEVKPGQEVVDKRDKGPNDGYDIAEELDLEEILREMDAEGAEPSEGIATENVELKRSLREHREVIQYLRSKLQEVNMLNAKLLYTNKLFRNYNLTNEQKLGIIEHFDRAQTTREVKLVFTTIAESLKSVKTSKKVKHITEGMASAPVASTKVKSASAEPIISGYAMSSERFKKLAGIRSNS